MVPNIRWSRVYLIEGETLALVDTGLLGGARKVEDYIRSIGRRPEDLELVLMTHSHPDHTIGAGAIVKRTGAKLVAHPGDTRAFTPNDVRVSYLGLMSGMLPHLPFLRGIPVGRTVEDGDVLPSQGGIRAIHASGHTPGSVCYLLEDRGVLFSGDTVFSDGETLGRAPPFPGANTQDYRGSLSKLGGMDFDALCGGHGMPLVGGASDRVRDMLSSDPDPPTWGQVIKRVPRRVFRSVGLG